MLWKTGPMLAIDRGVWAHVAPLNSMLNDFRFKNTLIIKKKNHQVCIYCKKEDDSSLASEKADFLDSLDGV